MKHSMLCMAALLTALALSCTGAKKMDTTEIVKPTEAEILKGLEIIASKKIFFGHQSVGWNIIDGIKDVSSSRGIATPLIAEARTGSGISGAGLYHAEVGKNVDPMSKLRDFEAILRDGVGKSVDAALLKFCYVDFNASTDVDTLFGEYKNTMARLHAEFPELVIVYVTAPLTSDESGLKATVKRMIGRTIQGDSDNAVREAFNDKLRAEYSGKAPVFDLALIEASDAAGSATARMTGRGEYYSLRAEYTNDGGHLNEAGRQRAADWLAGALGRAFR